MSAPAKAPVDSLDLTDELQVAVELITCVTMAAYAVGDREHMNAICRVSRQAIDVIEKVQEQLMADVAGAPMAEVTGGEP